MKLSGSWWRQERTRIGLIGGAVALGFFVLLFWRAIFVVIQPGHAGVLYDLFRGTRLGVYDREGLHVKLPWNQMFIYDLRLQSSPVQVHALSREGMGVDIDVIVLFRPKPRELALLHKEIGPDYVERAVTPLSTSAVREYVAQHDSHELYTENAEILKRDIMAATRAEMGRLHVVVDNIVALRVILPKAVLGAIEQKLAEEQIAAAYAFRLEAERSEAQRLEIKGAGLNRYYSLVNGALSPPLLTWRGIEATVELAQSPNTKIVIVGSGRDQLPLILGSDITRSPEPRPGRPGPLSEGKPTDGKPAEGKAAPGGKAAESEPAPQASPRLFGPGGTPPSRTPGPATPRAGQILR